MDLSFLKGAKFRLVAPEKILPQQGVPSRISSLLLSQIPALAEPASLTPDARLLFAWRVPSWVVSERGRYRLVLSTGLGRFYEYLDRGAKIPVLVVPDKEISSEELYRLQIQVSLLEKLCHGLDLSFASQSVMGLWRALGKNACRELSPELTTKSGFARLTGINRKTQVPEPTFIQPQFRQEELLGGEK